MNKFLKFYELLGRNSNQRFWRFILILIILLSFISSVICYGLHSGSLSYKNENITETINGGKHVK